jgi:D-arabinose 1-dehydrogenase-like Zn-dependent alcohol dehydrogenase
VQYAKISGGTVAAIDITDEKLQPAKDLGADLVIDGRAEAHAGRKIVGWPLGRFDVGADRLQVRQPVSLSFAG